MISLHRDNYTSFAKNRTQCFVNVACFVKRFRYLESIWMK